MKGNGKVTLPPNSEGVIVIPELEEAMARFQPHKIDWSDKDIATLEKYYGRVPIQTLASTLHRSTQKLHEKAGELGMKRGVPR